MKPTQSKPTQKKSPGWCALVGAGPGDPELLTLQALRTLRQATVWLVDDLVSEAVLGMALRGRRKPPRIVRVGKRGGCASTPQAFIEKLMVQHALAGERVARLKGGDPFVFGRGGEEAQALRAAGVEVRVVHGITSGLVAASQLGVAWTHRDHARGVMLVTGHARQDAQQSLQAARPAADASEGAEQDGHCPGQASAPDWAVLGAAAAQGLTLVIYMGMARLLPLQQGLLAALPADTPAAVVQHAGTPQERQLVCSLGQLAQAAAAQGMGSPAIVLIGDVLRARLAAALGRLEAA